MCSKPQQLEHLRALQQHRHRGRLAAGHHQRINRRQLLSCAYLLRRAPEGLKDRRVSGERTLKGENSNGRCYQPRSANFMSRVEISWPTIASPRPVETFTRIAGS